MINYLKEFLPAIKHPIGIIGIIGQSLFFTRFLIQWIVSERHGKSIVPVAFWYFSLIGALLTFVYAIWRKDPVFSISQIVGIFVYIRNLILIYCENRNIKVIS